MNPVLQALAVLSAAATIALLLWAWSIYSRFADSRKRRQRRRTRLAQQRAWEWFIRIAHPRHRRLPDLRERDERV
jgi:protein-S-isoprenylcysteine O-methyltransferase Ste14